MVRVDDLPHGSALSRLLDQARADALLLRPDRIVAAAADTPNLRAWRRHLRAAGIHPAETPQDVRHPDHPVGTCAGWRRRWRSTS